MITAAPSDCIPANEKDLVFEVLTWPDERDCCSFNIYYLSRLISGTETSTFVNNIRVRMNSINGNMDRYMKTNHSNGCTIRLVSRRPKIKKPRASKRQSKIWKDNSIQFPRLIAEMNAAGAFNVVIYGTHVMKLLAESMDLTEKQVREIIDRADTEFVTIKAKLYEEQENGH